MFTKSAFQLYSDFNYIIVTEFSVYSSIDWKHQMPVPISRCMILNTQHSWRYSKLWLNIQFSKESISYAIPLQSSFIVISIHFAMNFFLTQIVHLVSILDINLIFEIMSQCTVSDIPPTKCFHITNYYSRCPIQNWKLANWINEIVTRSPLGFRARQSTVTEHHPKQYYYWIMEMLYQDNIQWCR